MAAGRLPEPGTEFGPCPDAGCGHTDCDATRRMAAANCAICSEPIGYDVRFYDSDDGIEHALCAELQIEALTSV